MPAKRIELTKFRINKVMRDQQLRAQNSDFDRFKAMVLRRQVAKHVRSWVK